MAFLAEYVSVESGLGQYFCVGFKPSPRVDYDVDYWFSEFFGRLPGPLGPELPDIFTE
jgi:hypothetical protein